jgi:uncharacterized protein with GYD domain
MRRFSLQISFTSSAWHSLMEDPVDPLAPIRAPIRSLGGRLKGAFFTEDSFDVLAIAQFPDNISPADLSIAFYSGGSIASIHTSPLLTASQAHEAKRKSNPSSYRPNSRALAASAS